MEWNGNGSGLQVYRWALSPGSDANASPPKYASIDELVATCKSPHISEATLIYEHLLKKTIQ